MSFEIEGILLNKIDNKNFTAFICSIETDDEIEEYCFIVKVSKFHRNSKNK